MTTRLLFNVSAILEVLLGIALLFAPVYVIGLLVGDGLSLTGAGVARVLGITLISLGISAWETARQEPRQATRVGICVYNVGAATLLSILGTLGGMYGPLLWPAVGLHGLIGIKMLWVILTPHREKRKAGKP